MRRIALLLATAGGLTIGLAGPAEAATLVVTKTIDTTHNVHSRRPQAAGSSCF